METTSNTKIIDSLVQRFLVIGKTEGYSYLILLFIAMPLKYAAGFPIAVRIAGSLHGILFIAFVYYILKMLQANRLDLKKQFSPLFYLSFRLALFILEDLFDFFLQSFCQ